jgi:hypothetical protein
MGNPRRPGLFQISLRELVILTAAAALGLGWFVASASKNEKITIRSVDVHTGELKLNVPRSLITKVAKLTLKTRPGESLRITHVEQDGPNAVITIADWRPRCDPVTDKCAQNDIADRRSLSRSPWLFCESDIVVR